MTFASPKLVCVLAATGLGAAAFAGCGQDVPSGSVAKVGDDVIEKSEFDKWLRTAAQGQGAQPGGQTSTPDPPDFKKCVAAKGKQPAPTGTKKPAAAALKKQCKQEYDQLKGEVMQFLIQSSWVEQEAKAQKVKISSAEVTRTFEQEKKRAFPTDKAYQAFLKTSGMSEKDILFRIRLDSLQQKLTQKVTQKATKISEKDISSYYAKNKKRFAQPEQRDLNVVLTKTEAKAKQAQKALDGGTSFKAVSKKYSIDEASKAQGGKLPNVPKGQQEKALDQAVFKAGKGKLEGPVKTQFGYYVFEVTKVKPASQQTLEQSKETIRNLLLSQRQQKALDKFIKDFREEYKEKTSCADDFKIAECKNAPKEKTDTGPVSGGSPGGQAPQQAPPGGAPAPQGGAPAPQGGAPAPPQAPQGGAPPVQPQPAPAPQSP